MLLRSIRAHLLPSLATLALAFVVTLLVTPIVRALALRTSAVAHPRADRWHRRAVALLGGTAVWSSAVAVAAFLGGTLKLTIRR